MPDEWTRKRIKAIIDYYGFKFFFGKRVLDLGPGDGEVAAAFARLGADITCVDARQSNLDFISKKYPFVKTLQADLDNHWPFFPNQFDVILSLDLLCHLKNYEKHIEDICAGAETIILETEVLDSEDNSIRVPIYEEKTANNLSFHGEGSVISAVNIQNKLSSLSATFKRLDDKKLNEEQYVYDWKHSFVGRRFGLRRIFFIRKDKYLSQIAAAKPIYDMIDKDIIKYPAPEAQSHDYIPSVGPPPAANNDMKHFIHNVMKDDMSQNPNAIIRLYYNYYEDKDIIRKKEIDFCLSKNINNSLFETVILESPTNPTYNFFFEKINALSGPDDINIICNSDIFFDDSILLAKNIKHKELYALSCWDHHHPNNIIFRNESNSQDTWIIRGKVENVNGSFSLGTWACDNRIAYEFHKSGYRLLNPGKSIRTYHYHNSGLKRHSPRNPVPGPYLFIMPTEISC